MKKIKEWIKGNYIFPRILKIEIEQKYYDENISTTLTTTEYYYWIGTKYIKWLWWTFKQNFKDFDVFDSTLRFKKIPPKSIPIEIMYYKQIK